MKYYNNIPTEAQWQHQLPPWKKLVFKVLCRVIGDINALEVCGYHRYLRKKQSL